MIKRVHHIAIAVKNTDEVLETYSKVLGLKPSHSKEMNQLKLTLIPIGDVEIELVEPTSPETTIANFIESRGEGVHHICLEVEDIAEELRSLAAKGVELIDKEPREGVEGRIGFIHPRSTNGVLIELVQTE